MGIGLLLAAVILVASTMIAKRRIKPFAFGRAVYTSRRRGSFNRHWHGAISIVGFQGDQSRLDGLGFLAEENEFGAGFYRPAGGIFGISSHKAVLFYPAAILAVYLFAEGARAAFDDLGFNRGGAGLFRLLSSL